MAHAEAAVDRDERPGDVAGGVASKELDRPRNVVHRAEPAQRELPGIFLDEVGAKLWGFSNYPMTYTYDVFKPFKTTGYVNGMSFGMFVLTVVAQYALRSHGSR